MSEYFSLTKSLKYVIVFVAQWGDNSLNVSMNVPVITVYKTLTLILQIYSQNKERLRFPRYSEHVRWCQVEQNITNPKPFRSQIITGEIVTCPSVLFGHWEMLVGFLRVYAISNQNIIIRATNRKRRDRNCSSMCWGVPGGAG